MWIRCVSSLGLQATYDNPIQVAAYVGAFNHDPKYDVQVKEALLVVAYNDGSPASVLNMNQKQIDIAWKKWLNRLELYQRMLAFSSQ